MNSALRVDVADTHDETVALALAGELGLGTATVLYSSVQGALADHTTVILDLTKVTFCDSSGLNTLLRLRRHAQGTDRRLILVAPPTQMMRLLTITGTGAIFTIYSSLAEARRNHSAPGGSATP
ncbi:STAS domain-containing protein [Streptomyces sp. NPDC005395]|uniref:STAS domain-containing protein n=1 Tax=Streptomyces sp. NPDC005395 TaxID=3157042 RepID=UPI0033A4D1F9